MLNFGMCHFITRHQALGSLRLKLYLNCPNPFKGQFMYEMLHIKVIIFERHSAVKFMTFPCYKYLFQM